MLRSLFWLDEADARHRFKIEAARSGIVAG
jgi:hypothetical protein